MRGLARDCALFVSLGSTLGLVMGCPPQVNANQAKPRVAFRVGRVVDGSLRLAPIYPAKIGVKQTVGDSPKEGELLTCYISQREIVKSRDADGDFQVTRMYLDCLNGAKFEVVGIEY